MRCSPSARVWGGCAVSETSTDCRTPEGMTVGLVDCLIAVCRVLAKRDLSGAEVGEALRDFRDDEDVRAVWAAVNRLDREGDDGGGAEEVGVGVPGGGRGGGVVVAGSDGAPGSGVENLP